MNPGTPNWPPRSGKSVVDARRLVDARLEEIVRYSGEGTELDPPPDLDAEEAWYLIAAVDRVAEAARDVRRLLEGRVAETIGEGGAARFGDVLVRYSRPREYVATDGLVAFLRTLTVDDVLRVLPKPRTFRIGGLRAVAEREGLDPDTLEGTFYVDRSEDAPPRLTTIPVSNPNAPKYAAAMSDGEIRRRNPK